MIDKGKIETYLRSANNKTILVVGDLMIDEYISGKVTRISPEAPVPVLEVREEWSLPGGAANVALNIQCLGTNAIMAGYVGNDKAGGDLIKMLEDVNVDVSCIVRSEDVCTTVKTRILTDCQQIVRVDREKIFDCATDCEEILKAKIGQLISGVDAIIVEDYRKGTITASLIRYIVDLASANGIPVGLDPKDDKELDFSGITIAKPNFKEACLAVNIHEPSLKGCIDADAVLLEIGDKLLEKWQTEVLLISLGAMGMYLHPRIGTPVLIPTKAKKVFDVSGAGDTVIATFMSALVGGANYEESAHIANYAAGVVVGKLGTSSCCVDEIIKF
ncbi:MAG: PfkB family carbohydrate kinase [Kiritimatiellae bacterium]|jgi:rfaE bifunctional protein kinase chain/domain|nr:PfkB family carbohydrate kinase [Kiritimatiellia bacterium]